MSKDACDLCGLPLRYGAVVDKNGSPSLCFCCFGCKQVYQMLMETGGGRDIEDLKQSDIYQRCLAAGIIPADENALQQRQAGSAAATQENETTAGLVPQESEHLSLDLKLEGMWCPACAWVIEETLNKQRGIREPRCVFSTDRLRLRYDPRQTSPREITEMIQKLGYSARRPRETRHSAQAHRQWIRLAVVIFLSMNVMMLSFALYSGFFISLSQTAVRNLTWPIVIMAGIVFFYGGAPIHRKAFFGVISASPGMETLITLGAGSAFGFSLFNWLSGSIHLYFDTASMLIALVLVGKAVEQRTRNRVHERIGSFLDLQPIKARICTDRFPDGRYVDAAALTLGDVFRVDAGEIVPADGRVVCGEAAIDESALTGEAKPARRSRGDPVKNGTHLKSGTINALVTAPGSQSILGQLVAVMESALEKKAQLEDIGHRLLRLFVPAVTLLALATAVVCLSGGAQAKTAVIRAVTVLVISCPCALGVAIPLAKVAGIALAAQKGILVHHFFAFPAVGRQSAVVFDKTGTLTKGEWQLLEILALDKQKTERLLSLAAGLEQHCTHYVAEAIVHAARQNGIEPQAFRNVKELKNGIQGRFADGFLQIGSAALIKPRGNAVKSPPEVRETPNAALKSEIYMALNGCPIAKFVFGDTIRASARDVVAKLQKRGVSLSIVSGDSRQATEAVGRQLGISDCHGHMLPEEKARYVGAMKQNGHVVTMVGDGINDVAAMAAADLGIAVLSGQRIGIEAPGITLMGGDPAQIFVFENLAKAVVKTIRQNLWFTFCYNAISIPIAMSGLLNPLVAVSAMLLSSLSVTGNTLFIKRRCRR